MGVCSFSYDTITVLADGVLLVGKAAEVHENCRFVFAVAVSHYSMLGSLAPCWSTSAPGERGGGLLADRLGFAAKQSPGVMQ